MDKSINQQSSHAWMLLRMKFIALSLLFFAMLGAVFLSPLSIKIQKIASRNQETSNLLPSKPKEAAQLLKLPFYFEKNEGQIEANVKYLSRGKGYQIYFTNQQVVMVLQKVLNENSHPLSTYLSIQFIGAKQEPFIKGIEEQTYKTNYFVGSNSEQWRSNIPNFAKVCYEELYPGIDAIFYGNEEQFEYDISVAPRANPQDIHLHIEGAHALSIDLNGNLCISVDHEQQMQMQKPIVYQMIQGKQVLIEGSFTLLAKNEVGFHIGEYDHNERLIIDPVLIFSTYLGGSSPDVGNGIAVDSSGNAYIAGDTLSANFPTLNPYQSTLLDTRDAFITKVNSAGVPIYSTYLGGNDITSAFGITVDSSEHAYIVGGTSATNFPIVNAFQSLKAGMEDAFVTKLDPTGSVLIYSTYLGGTGEDEAETIAADSGGNAYIIGTTSSSDFPTLNALQPTLNGAQNAFVTKLNSAGNGLIYSTYLGGDNNTHGNSLTIDYLGNVFVTGETNSTNFPIVNAFQPLPGGANDAYIAKISSSGANLIYSSYLGGTADEFGSDVAIDNQGNAYVTGYTSSINFPTLNALQPLLAGTTNTFITKVSPTGSLIFSTYLGGSGVDQAFAILVDNAGNAYTTGGTTSPNFPTVNPYQATIGGGADVFLTKINSAGSTIIFSTYLGGSGDDRSFDIGADIGTNIYITGLTASGNFPTLNAFQSTYGGSDDAFIASFAIGTPIITNISPSQGPTAGQTIVTITGTNLGGATQVHFGPNLATIISITPTQIIVISPPGVGLVDVTVTTIGGTSPISFRDRFRYIPPTVIFPPNHLKGTQKINEFATQKDIVNILTWEAPDQGNRPIAYRIYRDAELSELIGTVSSQERLKFSDHNRKKDKTYRYWIVSIDEFGNISEPAEVRIKGH